MVATADFNHLMSSQSSNIGENDKLKKTRNHITVIQKQNDSKSKEFIKHLLMICFF
jgi:hypothetical protein